MSDAFYEKDSSKLELVVKVKNCSDSKLLPIVKYDYKMDIAVKKEEAFHDGMQAKALETARKLLADNKYTAEEISELLQLPIESFTETSPIEH